MFRQTDRHTHRVRPMNTRGPDRSPGFLGQHPADFLIILKVYYLASSIWRNSSKLTISLYGHVETPPWRCLLLSKTSAIMKWLPKIWNNHYTRLFLGAFDHIYVKNILKQKQQNKAWNHPPKWWSTQLVNLFILYVPPSASICLYNSICWMFPGLLPWRLQYPWDLSLVTHQPITGQ